MSIATEQNFTYNPHDPAVMDDPMPYYVRLRDDHPMYFIEEYDAWAVSRFEDVWNVMADRDGNYSALEGTVMQREQLLVPNGGVLPPYSRDPLAPFFKAESPMVEEVRQAHMAPLKRGAVKRLEDFVRAIVRARLDALLPTGRFNLTADYGGEVSAATMLYLFGLPLTMARHLLDVVNAGSETSEEVGGLVGGDQDSLLALHREMLLQAVRPRRAAGGDGRMPLIDGLIHYRFEGRALSDEEIADQLICALIGGVETLPKVAAHGIWELWRHPEQLAEVRADLPANCAIAFEEITRYCGPAQWFVRQVAKPVSVGGRDLKVGQRVILLIQSAARDPREFDEPDVFRWNRPIPRSVAFGWGQHFCIGIHLAKLEGRILLEEFFARVPEFEIDEAAARRPPSSFQWGWMDVPVEVPTGAH